jgi:autotransporter-associated beta strand protein
MRGKGLTLPVAEGAVFRSDALFFGSGDLVKTGAGTLAFGDGAFAVSGTVRVEEGTLDLSRAGTVTNAVFAGGGGVVSGAAFGAGVEIDPGIGADWTSGELPVFENCSFSSPVYVKIDPSLASSLTLPSDDDIPVAKFTGAAPDVSRWRVRNVWNERGVRGRFTVEGDTVRMTVMRAGFSVIIR